MPSGLPSLPSLPSGPTSPLSQQLVRRPGEDAKPLTAGTFAEFLRTGPRGEVFLAIKDYKSFMAAQTAWEETYPVSRKRLRQKTCLNRDNRASLLRHRMATAEAYLSWRSGPGAGVRDHIRAFLRSAKGYDGIVPNRDCCWLRRSIRGLTADGGSSLERLRRGRTAGSRKSASGCLIRRRGMQGAPVKCGPLREELFAWFVDIRGSLATRISPRFVLMKAKELADIIVKEQVRTKHFTDMPVIDHNWLSRWKRDKGVCFRKPNLRFKVSKSVLLQRVKATWLNILRVRAFAVRVLGRDLVDSFYGIDETPIHFNENGSNNVGTLMQLTLLVPTITRVFSHQAVFSHQYIVCDILAMLHPAHLGMCTVLFCICRVCKRNGTSS